MTQNFLVKGISFSFDSVDDTNDRVIFQAYSDANNYYTLHKTIDSKLELVKTVGGVSTTLTSTVFSFTRFQVLNVFFSIDSVTGTKMSYLLNGGNVVTLTNVDTAMITGNINMYFHNNDGTLQPDCFIESIYTFNNQTFTDDQISCMLHGRNIVDTNNASLNTLGSQFANANLISEMLPNNQYTVTGSATLYVDGYMTRTINDEVFVANGYENKIVLGTGAVCSRLD